MGGAWRTNPSLPLRAGRPHPSRGEGIKKNHLSVPLKWLICKSKSSPFRGLGGLLYFKHRVDLQADLDLFKVDI